MDAHTDAENTSWLNVQQRSVSKTTHLKRKVSNHPQKLGEVPTQNVTKFHCGKLHRAHVLKSLPSSSPRAPLLVCSGDRLTVWGLGFGVLGRDLNVLCEVHDEAEVGQGGLINGALCMRV